MCGDIVEYLRGERSWVDLDSRRVFCYYIRFREKVFKLDWK